MAINDVSLTAGMRSNLLSLQGTVDLLNRTQNRLSSGKKVNTAIDNPVSFFASQALTSRASIIDSLKDAMGQAVQTITAADKGITAISAMIEQAKGIAQSALSAQAGTAFDTETVTLNTVVDGNTIQIGATILTAGPSGVATTTTLTSQTMTVSSALDVDDTVVVGGITFTAKDAVSSEVSAITLNMSGNTMAAGNTVEVGGVIYSAVAAATSYNTFNLHIENAKAGNTVSVGGVAYTAVASTTTTTYDKFTVDLTNVVAGDIVTVGGTGYTAVAGAKGADNEFTIDTIAGAFADLSAGIREDSPTNFAISGLNGSDAFDITGADGHTLVQADVTSSRAGAVVADTTTATNTVAANEFKVEGGMTDADVTAFLAAQITSHQLGALTSITPGGIGDRDIAIVFAGDHTALTATSVSVGNTAGSNNAMGTTATTMVDPTNLSATQFVISGSDAQDAINLRAKINNLQSAQYASAVSNGIITITANASDLAANTVVATAAAGAIATSSTTSDAGLGQFEFGIGADENATAASLAAKMSAFFGAQLGVANASSCNVISVSSGTTTISATTVQSGTATAGELTIASVNTVTTADAFDAGYFAVTGDNTVDAATISNLINNTAAITGANYSATSSAGVITIANSAANVAAGNVLVTGGTMTEDTVAAASDLSDLQGQYNEMRAQMTAIAEDSGYKGKNLLSATAGLRTLDVQFEGNTLNVAGFDATATATSDLALGAATWTAAGDSTATTAAINADLVKLDDALSTMRSKSSQLSGNLSIITVRQNFSTNMINTLTAGSDLLTMADANEEGANMLMLQTRQSLSTTALSLSAQAAQSVLKLFG